MKIRRRHDSVGARQRGPVRGWLRRAIVGLAIAAVSVTVVASALITQAGNQAPRPVGTIDGKPNFSGIWQALNEAHWDVEAHEARPAVVTQPGVYPHLYARVPAAPVLALGRLAAFPHRSGWWRETAGFRTGRRRLRSRERMLRTGSIAIRS